MKVWKYEFVDERFPDNVCDEALDFTDVAEDMGVAVAYLAIYAHLREQPLTDGYRLMAIGMTVTVSLMTRPVGIVIEDGEVYTPLVAVERDDDIGGEL